MSQNFELLRNPSFHRGLMDELKSSHIAQQIRRDKLRIQQQQHISSSSSFRLQSQESEVEESRANNAISRSGYSVLPGIGGQIYDPNGMISSQMIGFQAQPVKDSVVPNQNVQICQPNTHYILNFLQNPGTHNPVLGSMISSSVNSRFPICYPHEQSSVSFISNNGSREDGDKGCTVLPLSYPVMQQNPVQQSQFTSQYHQEIKQSLGPNESGFGNCQIGQSGFNAYGGTYSRGEGLSLSLSFHNPHDFEGQNLALNAASVHSFGKHKKDFMGSSGNSCSYLKDDENVLRVRENNPAPLGPFSGSSDVLKDSKFLKPAQLLLEEAGNMGKMAISSVSGDEEQVEMNGCFEGPGLSSEIPSSVLALNPLGISSTCSVYPSTCAPAKVGAANGISGCVDSNEHRKKKNRLISLLDEVYRQYLHYSLQLQAVLTSFESRVGLNNAAPYASMALKALSRHFQNLKNAINGQLKFASKVLGEDCSSAGNAGIGEMSSLRLEGHRCGKSDGLSIDPLQLQHVWRPQRGFPERAVAVLRNWLFEHFLHPYPSDMDKQMLAEQTGITRSQVSNWFINARVRLWKPLVEEIHSLEMKDSSSFRVLNSMKKPEHNIDSSNHESAFQHSKRSRWASDDNGDAGWVNNSYQSSQTLDKGRRAMGAVGGVSLTLGLPSQRPLLASVSP